MANMLPALRRRLTSVTVKHCDHGKAFAGEALDVVLSAYLDGLQVCFIFGAVVSGVAILISFFAPFRSIKQGGTVTAHAA